MSTLKKAAKAIHEGYTTLLKGHKDITITHRSTDEGQVVVHISGPESTVDSISKKVTGDLLETIKKLTPVRAHIHQTDVLPVQAGTEGHASINIHHTITTY